MSYRTRSILLLSAGLLAACSARTAGDNAAGANTAAPANGVEAASTTAAAPAEAAQPQQLAGARPVRFGVDGEHGMDACHTSGRISGQDSVGILSGPSATAGQSDATEPGLAVDICETIPGWYGIVYRKASDPAAECGTGENLPGPRDYSGPCRSGWVPEASVEVTAG